MYSIKYLLVSILIASTERPQSCETASIMGVASEGASTALIEVAQAVRSRFYGEVLRTLGYDPGEPTVEIRSQLTEVADRAFEVREHAGARGGLYALCGTVKLELRECVTQLLREWTDGRSIVHYGSGSRPFIEMQFCADGASNKDCEVGRAEARSVDKQFSASIENAARALLMLAADRFSLACHRNLDTKIQRAAALHTLRYLEHSIFGSPKLACSERYVAEARSDGARNIDLEPLVEVFETYYAALGPMSQRPRNRIEEVRCLSVGIAVQ